MKQRFEEGDSKCFQSKVLDRSRSAPSRGIENVLYYQEFLLSILCYWIIHVQHWLKIIIYLPKNKKTGVQIWQVSFFHFLDKREIIFVLAKPMRIKLWMKMCKLLCFSIFVNILVSKHVICLECKYVIFNWVFNNNVKVWLVFADFCTLPLNLKDIPFISLVPPLPFTALY